LAGLGGCSVAWGNPPPAIALLKCKAFAVKKFEKVEEN
jgi:hypothetical protein